MIKKDFFYYLIFSFVLILFLYLFFLSTKYIINFWTFSQAHINYSDGFVKRGLFGTIAILLEKKFNVKFITSFNIFFIIFYLINLFLFFLIIKQYSKLYFTFIFLALSPTLILFSFNDLGGFQRFDIISIFLILLHSYFVNLLRSEKINFENYKRKFFTIIFPSIIISLFIHEIQCWSIPFHFFMIKMIYDEKNKNFIELLKYFSLLVAASIFVFTYPVTEETINSMVTKIDDGNLWIGAITVASSSEGNLNIINQEIRTNFLNIYNLKINIFFLIMGTLPMHFLLSRLNKNQIIKVENKKLYLYFYLSIIPYLAFFAIGDTGRWLHIISIVSFGFLSQYPINTKNYNNIISRSYLSKVLIFILLIIYCFFVRLPHAGNLEKKEITIWGGLYKKFEAAYYIYFNEIKDDKFNLNKRFKKN